MLCRLQCTIRTYMEQNCTWYTSHWNKFFIITYEELLHVFRFHKNHKFSNSMFTQQMIAHSFKLNFKLFTCVGSISTTSIAMQSGSSRIIMFTRILFLLNISKRLFALMFQIFYNFRTLYCVDLENCALSKDNGLKMHWVHTTRTQRDCLMYLGPGICLRNV